MKPAVNRKSINELQGRQRLWERLAQLSRTSAHKKLGVVIDRGAPKTPQEQLELMASLIENDLDLQNLLLIVEPNERQTAYDQLTPRLSFKPRSFNEVMSL